MTVDLFKWAIQEFHLSDGTNIARVTGIVRGHPILQDMIYITTSRIVMNL